MKLYASLAPVQILRCNGGAGTPFRQENFPPARKKMGRPIEPKSRRLSMAVKGWSRMLKLNFNPRKSWRELRGGIGIYLRLLTYLTPYWKYMAGAMALTLIMNAGTLVQPFLIKIFTDNVLLSKEDFHARFVRLNLVVAAYLLLVIFRGSLAYFQGWMMNWAGQRSLKRMRDHVFQHLQGLPITFYEKWRLGEIYSRSTNDVSMTSVLSGSLISLANDFMVVIVALGYMFSKSVFMTCLNLLVAPLIAIAVTKFGRRIGAVTESLQAKVADLAAIIYENIYSMKVVKSFTRENFEIRRFNDKNEENFATTMKMVQYSLTQGPVVELLAALGVVLVIWFGAYQILRGRFTMGEMMAYWGFMVLMTQPLNRLSGTYSSFQSAKAAARRVFQVLDTPTEVKDKPGAVALPHLAGKVEYQQITFAYEGGPPVLHDINLVVEPGQMVALVGHNGAGKTSLVNLIPRFYEVSQGLLLVDGHDISKLKLDTLRRQISIVPQETVLFGGTIRDNIAYGRVDASEAEIVAASKTANAHDFIMELPRGYDSAIGERGVLLSGGQRQRIAIARALLRNPRILILDEFTSGVDTESEHLISQAIERLMKDRTTFVIAHRLATVRNADIIVVLENGQIMEQGSHDQLLDRKGPYWRLYHAQHPEADLEEVAGESAGAA